MDVLPFPDTMLRNDVFNYPDNLKMMLKTLILMLYMCEIYGNQCANRTTPDKEEVETPTEIKLGFLSTTESDYDSTERVGLVINGVMPLIVDHINNRSDILPNTNLTYTWTNTGGHELGNIKAMTDQWRDGVVAFFGPENTCTTEARIAAAWNIPMISYVSII